MAITTGPTSSEWRGTIPAIAADWGITDPVLSGRDQKTRAVRTSIGSGSRISACAPERDPPLPPSPQARRVTRGGSKKAPSQDKHERQRGQRGGIDHKPGIGLSYER